MHTIYQSIFCNNKNRIILYRVILKVFFPHFSLNCFFFIGKYFETLIKLYFCENIFLSIIIHIHDFKIFELQ